MLVCLYFDNHVVHQNLRNQEAGRLARLFSQRNQLRFIAKVNLRVYAGKHQPAIGRYDALGLPRTV